MDSGKLSFETEVGPRFEIFYALHKLAAPESPATAKWRKSARSRLGARVLNDAKDVAPEPLMWAILADSTLGAERIESFADLVTAIESQDAEDFRSNILAGVPDVRGLNLAAQFETLLRNADDYRAQLLAVLRGFWSRAFEEDFTALLPELNRLSRQLLATSASAARSNAGARLGIPISVDDSAGDLAAGRSGYKVPLARAGRLLLLPSAFNLNHWWTKRDDGNAKVDFFFPISDGTITPNDALTGANASGEHNRALQTNLQPELMFRALGDTTRYAIATILARAPTTPTDLSRQLKVSKPTITHHVHALRDAGLIIDGGEGGRLALDRSRLEQLSAAAVSELFASEGKLRLARTRKKTR